MWAEFFKATAPQAGEIRSDSSSKVSWNAAIRQSHRVLAIVFTVTVVANFVSMALGKSPAWIVYIPLIPLFLLLFTGLYMFALPYLERWRGRVRSG
jgi:hypothetical protein